MSAQHPTWKILALWGIILIPVTWAVAHTLGESLRLISAR